MGYAEDKIKNETSQKQIILDQLSKLNEHGAEIKKQEELLQNNYEKSKLLIASSILNSNNPKEKLHSLNSFYNLRDKFKRTINNLEQTDKFNKISVLTETQAKQIIDNSEPLTDKKMASKVLAFKEIASQLFGNDKQKIETLTEQFKGKLEAANKISSFKTKFNNRDFIDIKNKEDVESFINALGLSSPQCGNDCKEQMRRKIKETFKLSTVPIDGLSKLKINYENVSKIAPLLEDIFEKHTQEEQ